jgi:hypothetical protein
LSALVLSAFAQGIKIGIVVARESDLVRGRIEVCLD